MGKKKIHVNITIDEENAFEKIQHQFLIKTESTLGVEGSFPKLVKHIYKKPKATMMLNSQSINAFPKMN